MCWVIRGTTLVRFTVDEKIYRADGFNFEIDPFRKSNLLSGLDDIGLTLKHADKIDQYEQQHKKEYPWLWA